MEYKLYSPVLQDIQTSTVELKGTATELGTIDGSGNLLIPTSGLCADFVAANVFSATNLTASEALTATIVGANLVLDGSTALTASNKISLTLRLPQPLG